MSISRKSIISNNRAAMPDFSRVVDLGWDQHAWLSTEAECYSAYSNGTLTDGVPYVIQLNAPCYLIKQIKTGSEDDGDWGIWMGPNRSTVAIENRSNNSSAGHILENISSYHSGVIFGKNLFYFGFNGNASNSDTGITVFPLSMVGWYYRPLIGVMGSSNELFNYHQFLLVPCHDTPSGTLLATKYLFTSVNDKGYMNTAPVWGTVSGDYCTKTYTYSSTKSVTHKCKAKFYCP